MIIVEENQFNKLKKLKQIDESDSEEDYNTMQLGQYDPLYQMRLNKASKRYNQIQIQKQKEDQLNK